MFPSYLRHWVYPNESEEERVTIAFNARFAKTSALDSGEFCGGNVGIAPINRAINLPAEFSIKLIRSHILEKNNGTWVKRIITD